MNHYSRMVRWVSAIALIMASIAVPVAASPIDLTLSDIDGKRRTLSEFRGKWVVVNFWATWCPPCLEELPELEIFHNNHKDKDAVVVGINLEEIGEKRLRAFLQDQLISFPILLADPGEKSPFGSIRSLPTTFIVTPEGEAVARQTGQVTREMIENYIANYNKKKANKKE